VQFKKLVIKLGEANPSWSYNRIFEEIKRTNPELVPADDGRGVEPFSAYHEDMGRKSDQRYPDV
jgi:hypothetical protein